MIPNKYYVTYDKIDNLCRKSADIISHGFKPDLILAIGGGGLIPARIMRTILNVPIYVISLSTYENETPIDEPRVVQWHDFKDIRESNKRVLIVDEVDDTRKTLKFLVNKLVNEEGLKTNNLGVFVIHNKLKEKEINNSDLNISYYHAGKSVEDKWIVYPWD